MPLTPDALAELSAQETSTAWLVLITLDHPDLDMPIRVTSDGVATVSNGNIFSPFPFEVTLPDDVEGRAPQAQLRIDNTSQEVIALLRGLASLPSLTIQIVRSADPKRRRARVGRHRVATVGLRHRRHHRHTHHRRFGDRRIPVRHLRWSFQGLWP